MSMRMTFSTAFKLVLLLGLALGTSTGARADWTGFYLGVGAGSRSSETDTQVTSSAQNGVNNLPAFCNLFATAGGCVTGNPLNGTAPRLSAYFGYNWQFAPRWVAGIEGDYAFADSSARLTGVEYPATSLFTAALRDQYGVKTGNDSSLRARIGYLVNPDVMVYATGGATWMRTESFSVCDTTVNSNCSPAAGSGPLTIVNSKYQRGWTVGGGLEFMLSPNLIARGEYRYADYGTISSIGDRALIGGAIQQTVTYDVAVKTHTATLGVAYKFGNTTKTVDAFAAVTAAPVSWSGYYLGLGAGTRGSQVDSTLTGLTIGNSNYFAPLCANCVTGAPLNDVAWRISGFGGWNKHLSSLWVAGVEADIGFADKTTTLQGMVYPSSTSPMSGRAVDTIGITTNWDASLRARLGFVATPTMLIYGTGGIAALQIETETTCGPFINTLCTPAITSGPFSITHSKTLLGWTVGGGIETMLGSNWTARVDYRYADFGATSFSDFRPGPFPVRATYEMDVRTHTATLGVAYKFD